MRTPAFWQADPDTPGPFAGMLRPLGMIYAALTARRVAGTGYLARIPIVCVGNLHAGGTGKTPTVIAVTQHLLAQGRKVHIVSRGYGGTTRGPLLVAPERQTAREVGDEPLLLAAFAPVWVSRNRALGVQAAEAAGAEIVVLDDGHQNPSVAKDVSIIVVDAAMGFGNGLCLPAGPLREPVDVGLARANLIVTIGSIQAQDTFSDAWGPAVALPRQRAELVPLRMGMDWKGQRVLAFAGIGHPEKFFATLRNLGADLVRAVPLDDHQPLSTALLQRLTQDAATLRAQLVTTEKDAVRLPLAYRDQILTLPVRLELAQPTVLPDALDTLLSSRTNL
jgi:tetraacyldisaccharide 4'-kinase